MHAARKILIVDDDVALRQSLAEQLRRDGEFVSVECDTAAAALETVGRERFDAILLDVGLPDMDGRDLCRAMRDASVGVPIVMLTAADSDGDTVQGLEAGANDYVTKPFRLNVLLARLRAHLRQSERRDDAVFAIGPYTFQPGAKLMTDTARRKKMRAIRRSGARPCSARSGATMRR
jgi:DNA-binding response OmpR family regulator